MWLAGVGAAGVVGSAHPCPARGAALASAAWGQELGVTWADEALPGPAAWLLRPLRPLCGVQPHPGVGGMGSTP